ncbi:MAG TPA: hypothetical protein VF005_07875 [Acidimicrobiales bacterium]
MPRRHRDAMVVLARGDVELATWPLWWQGRPGLEAVDELARLQLMAGRLGCSIRLRSACVELCELLDLVGLSDLLIEDIARPAQTEGEPEAGDELGPG